MLRRRNLASSANGVAWPASLGLATFDELPRRVFRARRVRIATNCPYVAAFHRLRAAFVGRREPRPAHGDNPGSLLTNTAAIPADATAPGTLAANSKAKPASCHCQPKKRRVGPAAEASECHTNSASVRDASSDSKPSPGSEESVRQIPAPSNIRIHMPPVGH